MFWNLSRPPTDVRRKLMETLLEASKAGSPHSTQLIQGLHQIQLFHPEWKVMSSQLAQYGFVQPRMGSGWNQFFDRGAH